MHVRVLAMAAFSLFVSGCGPVTVVDDPYESCNPSDSCSQNTACLATTLPASSGFTGYLCTVTCASDSNCPQDLTNYASICVNSQCYTQCPSGGASCPYGTGCVTFSDQNGNLVNLCTP
jgi:hypothetical protein